MVIMNTSLLEPDEYPFGYYKIQVVEWEEGDWNETGYWLNAIITNRRFMIFLGVNDAMLAQKVLQPLDIRKVWNVCLKGRDGVMIALKDGKRMYMLVDWSQGNKLVKDLNEMLTPPVKPRILPRLVPT
jgi:hypothetical protein